jgi:BMFP domain-containing protein YqiC
MIDKLGDAISAILPAGAGKELRTNIDAVIRSNFDKMNLVTREQFEIQEKVLHRTRGRILELEKQVEELEKLIKSATAENNSETDCIDK